MVAGNLLVTFHQYEKGHAETEMRARLKDVGAYIESIQPTNVEGVFEVLVGDDPKKIVADIRQLCLDDPGLFSYTHHWVPIERWIPQDTEEMVKITSEFGKHISHNERWMLHLHKRHIGIHSSDLIDRLTVPIQEGIVDLKNPQKIVIVELMGDRAGMSLVRCDELLDVNKVKGMIEIRMR
jgi:tRNA acetyltransferase TAN1